MSQSVPADLKGLLLHRRHRVNHAVRIVCRPIFDIACRPTILHRQRAARAGGYLLAANHHHAMDIPALMYATPRLIDFVSIAQVMNTPGLGAFYRQFQTITLHRGRVDPAAIRTIVGRLRDGRVVGFFPEARITAPQDSVTAGGPHRSGLGRIARLAQVPVLPAVVLDTARLMKPAAWLPLRRTRFAVAYGQPIFANPDLPPRESQHNVEHRWRQQMLSLTQAVRDAEHPGDAAAP